jgi:ribosome-binding protein aMBF1 (putative translation factor)
MSAAVKTRPISVLFKPRTPARIIRSVKSQFAQYIVPERTDDEYEDYFESDLRKAIAATMKPGDYLRHYREAHGLTQKEFAAKIGIRINYLSDMETGQRAISRAMAKKLAGIFNTSPSVFI